MIYKLNDLIETANTGADAIKRAPILQEKTNLRCLRIGDVSQRRKFNEWGYTKTSREDYKRYKLHLGDIIVARTGNTIGVNQYIDREIEAVYNNGLIRIKVNKEMILPKYFYYIVRGKSCQDYIQSIAYGTSTQPNMKIKDFLNFEIEVLGLDLQRGIVKIIDTIERKIAINEIINDNLQQQAVVLYQQMFTDSPEPDWTDGSLSDIADITMGQSPSGSSYNEDGIGTIFFQGRAEFGFRFPTIRLYTTEPKRMAYTNDILMSVRAPVGDLNVAHTDCCVGRGLAAIHSKTNRQSFMLYTMFSLKKRLDVFNGEGTVFGSINRSSLNDIPVLIPSNGAIENFERIVAPMDAAIRNNYDEICRLQEIRDSLLPKLMSGEIDVSNIQL
jgi:type I restriction enzyme S subunit